MRDLRDRAHLLAQQISAENTRFEALVSQLKLEARASEGSASPSEQAARVHGWTKQGARRTRSSNCRGGSG